MILNNTDKLVGSPGDKGYRLTTDFGEAEVAFNKLRRITFKKTKTDAHTVATVEMLNGTILRGRLNKDNLDFRVSAKIRLSIPTSMVTSLTRPEPIAKPDDKPETPPVIAPPIPVIGPAVRLLNVPGRAIQLDLNRD